MWVSLIKHQNKFMTGRMNVVVLIMLVGRGRLARREDAILFCVIFEPANLVSKRALSHPLCGGSGLHPHRLLGVSSLAVDGGGVVNLPDVVVAVCHIGSVLSVVVVDTHEVVGTTLHVAYLLVGQLSIG